MRPSCRNPEPTDFGEHVEQFVGKAIGKVLVVRTRVAVHKRQHSDGCDVVGSPTWNRSRAPLECALEPTQVVRDVQRVLESLTRLFLEAPAYDALQISR